MVHATDWKDPSSYVQNAEHAFPDAPGVEDADLWVDENGNFHAILRSVYHCGYHAFSKDGVTWGFGTAPPMIDSWCAFSTNVSYTDGTSKNFARRERPHLVYAADGTTPIALTSAVTYAGDASYTLLQPIDSTSPKWTPPAGTTCLKAKPGPANIPDPLDATLDQRPTKRRALRSYDIVAESQSGTTSSGSKSCDPGNDFKLKGSSGAVVTIGRTGDEGVQSYNDGAGSAMSHEGDDFLIELKVTRSGASPVHVTLGSAQMTTSARNCSLQAADCTAGSLTSATLVYYCIHDVKVTVTYALVDTPIKSSTAMASKNTTTSASTSASTSSTTTNFAVKTGVKKTLVACSLSSVAAGGKECDGTPIEVVSQTEWHGLRQKSSL